MLLHLSTTPRDVITESPQPPPRVVRNKTSAFPTQITNVQVEHSLRNATRYVNIFCVEMCTQCAWDFRYMYLSVVFKLCLSL